MNNSEFSSCTEQKQNTHKIQLRKPILVNHPSKDVSNQDKSKQQKHKTPTPHNPHHHLHPTLNSCSRQKHTRQSQGTGHQAKAVDTGGKEINAQPTIPCHFQSSPLSRAAAPRHTTRLPACNLPVPVTPGKG
ncbi:hypothetical protein ACOMHN_035571 [Nucella lapillus]